MSLDPAEIAVLLPFKERYELRCKRWCDGPYGSWEAFDCLVGREVVVNIPWAYTDVPTFIQSAKTAASFQHPGILPVYDLGIQEGGVPFFTTAPVRGEVMSQRLRQFDDGPRPTGGAYPLRPLVRAVRDACRALEYAHRLGFLHLDLHPDSLLIGDDDHVVLDVNDWKQAGGEANRTACVVRPPYMSPEQVPWVGLSVGPATDVFGLGGILHVILFGTPPNHLTQKGNPVDVMRSIVERAFEPRCRGPLRAVIGGDRGRRSVVGLVDACRKALEYGPKRRHQTAGELGAALDKWLENDRPAWWRMLGQA
ncbi:MAG: protein kinase domain-containing protein [Isosphaeraceae bacterium]